MSGKAVTKQRNVLLLGVDEDSHLGTDHGEDLSVRSVSRARDALDLLMGAPIDCVVSAFDLPDMNGLRFLQIARTKYPNLPFILCPADGDEALASRAIEVGATDYVSERDPDELERRIDEAVRAAGDDESTTKQGDLLSRAFESIDDAFYLIDENGQFILWNDTVCEFTGYDDAELASMSPVDLFEGESVERITQGIERAIEEGEVKVEAEVVRKDGETLPVEFTGDRLTDENGDLIGICGIGRDISERKRREQALREREEMLTALHDATRPLMGAELKEDIAELAVETADDVFDFSGAAIYLFDRGSDGLRPAAASPDISDIVDEVSVISDGDVGWDEYLTGEPRIYDDIRKSEYVEEPKTPLRSLVVVPLGDHGVFFAADTAVDAFSGVDVGFAELLAANTEAALDRAEREALLRERDSKLDRRNEQLEELNRINSVIRDIDQVLVGASSRAEIEQEVCERLVDTDPYRFAWICEYDADGGLRPRSWAGVDDGYIDHLTDGQLDGVPAELARRTGECEVVHDIFQDRQSEPWRREALKRSHRSMVSIPLLYQEASYGVLEIYSGQLDSFGDESAEILTELGETIGHAINSINRKDALMSDRVIQLEFDVQDENDFWARSARRLESTLDIQAFIPQDEGTYRTFVAIEENSPGGFIDAAEASTIVNDVSLISNQTGESLYECVVAGTTTVTTFAEYGAVPRKVIADGKGERVVAEVTRGTDVGAFVETFTSHYPNAELLARREQAGSGQLDGSFRESVTDRLTDRQQEVLQIAHMHGFFDWPRGATGEEVADSLDIAPSTFHQHIRAGQHKLLDVIFE